MITKRITIKEMDAYDITASATAVEGINIAVSSSPWGMVIAYVMSPVSLSNPWTSMSNRNTTDLIREGIAHDNT